MADPTGTGGWYESLAKPSWTPAPGTIGTIWTVLYPIIIVVFGWCAWAVWRGKLPPRVLVPVGLNVLSNVLFTPIQFGLRNLPLALLDILVVLGTLVWAIVLLWPLALLAAVALLPYLVWVSIATVLQASITAMNR
jgi:tryptophan-rich sensory protein